MRLREPDSSDQPIEEGVSVLCVNDSHQWDDTRTNPHLVKGRVYQVAYSSRTSMTVAFNGKAVDGSYWVTRFRRVS